MRGQGTNRNRKGPAMWILINAAAAALNAALYVYDGHHWYSAVVAGFCAGTAVALAVIDS
jgi:membrane-associated phospholipid phosphatase